MVEYSSFGGEGVGGFLGKLEEAGVFEYLLPVLIIFAIVYAILNFIGIFKNKAVNFVISLTVGILSLQFNIVSICFAEVFPRLGIALSVILIVLIFGGIFFKPRPGKDNWIRVLLIILTIGIILVVLVGSLNCLGFGGGFNFSFFYTIGLTKILIILGVVGLIIWIIFSSNSGGVSGRRGPFPTSRGPRAY